MSRVKGVLSLKRVAAVAILAAGWFLLFGPSTLGGPLTLVTVSGTSMEPTVHTGDLAVAYKYLPTRVGDVVAYHVPTGGRQGSLIIHRIMSLNDDGTYTTQGDNNPWVDPWKPSDQEIVGREVFFIPKIGKLVTVLSNPVVAAALAASVFVFFLILNGDKHIATRTSDEIWSDRRKNFRSSAVFRKRRGLHRAVPELPAGSSRTTDIDSRGRSECDTLGTHDSECFNNTIIEEFDRAATKA